jgi:DNA-binding GntR family transcriptional regulator
MDDLAALTAHDDSAALLTVDRRIHRFVYRTTKNPFLAETLDLYQNLSLRILHVAMQRYPPLTPRLDDVVIEQRTVLDAICRGDGATAERVAIEHISTFERAIREII